MAHTVFHTCSLCEATCGLQFEVENNEILSVRPDEDDVFSRGYVCPKGIAIADIHADPDRLRRPVRRNSKGQFEEISWDAAFDLVASRLREIRERHGSDAIGFYWGNPTGNNHGALLMLSSFTKALGTRNRFSSGSQDANPRIVTSYELYGSSVSIPIPDIDRTDYFLCLGGNPMISNGSVMTAPDMRRRLRAVRERGGKVVVVDPRRTETAKEADEHVAIRPGGDAAFLLAMVQVLVERGRVDRPFLDSTTSGWPEIERRLAAFTPARVAAFAGVPVETIERLALDFADARSAVCYSRVGVCVAAHATLATFATDLLNIVTGRLGREGGPMFTTPAFDISRVARMSGLDGRDRWRSRVRGLPETLGDLPGQPLGLEPRLHVPQGHVDGQWTPDRHGARYARLHGVDRHLHQRDHAPRRRHPAALLELGRGSHRSTLCLRRGAQHRATHPRGGSAPAPAAPLRAWNCRAYYARPWRRGPAHADR